MGRRPVGTRALPPPRPRYRRISAAAGSVAITLVAVGGGIGLLPTPTGAGPAIAAEPPAHHSGAIALSGAMTAPRSPGPSASSAADASTAPPADSGTGRRVVFDMSTQRVWLVGAADDVHRTYLVSGSLTDNLQPGSYQVYSRSMHAWGVDGSGTMEYMVRFAHGAHAAIGFHDIPTLDGKRVQARADLGTPQSHGCIRQWRPDAKALWRFAPVGTSVVVTG
jgi:hypothetical protein